MFPDHYDLPPRFPQAAFRVCVSSNVLGELVRPPVTVGFRHRAVERASVEETGADVDDDLRPGEDDVLTAATVGEDAEVYPVAAASSP